jgi:hypothetical protein
MCSLGGVYASCNSRAGRIHLGQVEGVVDAVDCNGNRGSVDPGGDQVLSEGRQRQAPRPKVWTDARFAEWRKTGIVPYSVMAWTA